MKAPRGLSAEEAAIWEALAKSVTPLHIAPLKKLTLREQRDAPLAMPAAPLPKKAEFAELLGKGVGAKAGNSSRANPSKPVLSRTLPHANTGLDSHWDRRLKSGALVPDFSLDLHGHSLDSAYDRLNDGLTQARAMGARLVLVVTGKPRGAEAADRGDKRGAIRAKILDWLAAGSHAGAIAAIRGASRQHGGEGAIYLVLKRARP